MDPIIVSDNLETAVVPHGTDLPKEEEEEPSSSSSDENEDDLPPGPVDPEKCTVGGPGTQGGSAQAPVSFHIQARDGRDQKLSEGGDYVVVRVIPGSTARAAGAKESEAIVKDNGDGSYTATYSVEARGDYQLTVEINGSAFGGSPFPVFFSPPDERATEAAFTDALGAPIDPSTVSAASDVPMPVISALGAAAYKADVKFPEDKDVLSRTVIVGEMNPAVNLEQLQKLFSYSGQVQDCVFSGSKNDFAFVTFDSTQEAEQALTLDKLLVIDRQIRVESAQSALDSKGQSGGVQYAALQLQQIQQLKKAQSEQHSLAAQVASMRVQAKQNPAAFAPGLPQNSASQKAAALSAIAALSRRLTGSAHGPAAPKDKDPGPQKRRREVSPTLRYRKDKRSRSRSRSPSRRRMSPPRRRSPVLILRRSPGRRITSREGRRDSSRDRHRRSRSPSRNRREAVRRRSVSRSRRDDDRGGSRHHREGDKERYREREERRRRTRSRSPARRARIEEGRDQKRHHSLDSKEASETPRKRRQQAPDTDRKHQPGSRGAEDGSRGAEDHSRENGPAAEIRAETLRLGQEAEGEAVHRAVEPDKDRNEAEAQALREKALEALHSLKSMDSANGDGLDTEQRLDEDHADEKKKRRHKSKHHKHGKHKKEKRNKKDPDENADLGLDLPEIDPEPHFSP